MTTLIIAAHPDDEVLGAGGYMAKHAGCRVAIVTEGTTGRDVPHQEALAAIHAKREATRAALEILGARLVFEGDFLDQGLTITDKGLHREITHLLIEHRPDVVLTHHPHEQNADHRVIAEAVGVACRAFLPQARQIQRVLSFIVDSWAVPGQASPPAHTVLVPLTEVQLQRKLDALRCYKEELRPWPHPRNDEAILHHAKWLGALSGTDAAEAYTLLWGRM